MCVTIASKSPSNLFILVMKNGQISYYGNSLNPFQLFLNRVEADNFIRKNKLGSLWQSTETTQEILSDYFTGSL